MQDIMNLNKVFRAGTLYDVYREEESAFKCTFDVGLDDDEDDYKISENDLMEVEHDRFIEDEDDEDTGDEVVTKEDMEETIRILQKESADTKERLLNLEEAIRSVKMSSIFRRKEILEREVLQTKCKLEQYLKQNLILKGLCFQQISNNYDQDLQRQLQNVQSSIYQNFQQISSIEVEKTFDKEVNLSFEDKNIQTHRSEERRVGKECQP